MAGTPLSVLLVDDEPLLLSSLRRCLRQPMTDIRTASSADEALVLIDQQIPDLVISDYRMPGSMNGLGLLERIHAEHGQVHCFLHTGEPVSAEIRSGPFRVLNKPCSIELLQELIEGARAALAKAPPSR